MATPKQPVLLDKDLHRQLKQRVKDKAEMTAIISRLVEMYLSGEVKVLIPERQV